MIDAFIYDGIRTPFGRYAGALAALYRIPYGRGTGFMCVMYGWSLWMQCPSPGKNPR